VNIALQDFLDSSEQNVPVLGRKRPVKIVLDSSLKPRLDELARKLRVPKAELVKIAFKEFAEHIDWAVAVQENPWIIRKVSVSTTRVSREVSWVSCGERVSELNLLLVPLEQFFQSFQFCDGQFWVFVKEFAEYAVVVAAVAAENIVAPCGRLPARLTNNPRHMVHRRTGRSFGNKWLWIDVLENSSI
jgi:hypothetical protein